jgi:hypothetical protein
MVFNKIQSLLKSSLILNRLFNASDQSYLNLSSNASRCSKYYKFSAQFGKFSGTNFFYNSS